MKSRTHIRWNMHFRLLGQRIVSWQQPVDFHVFINARKGFEVESGFRLREHVVEAAPAVKALLVDHWIS